MEKLPFWKQLEHDARSATRQAQINWEIDHQHMIQRWHASLVKSQLMVQAVEVPNKVLWDFAAYHRKVAILVGRGAQYDNNVFRNMAIRIRLRWLRRWALRLFNHYPPKPTPVVRP